jgi:uncharacterized low-complexity protein
MSFAIIRTDFGALHLRSFEHLGDNTMSSKKTLISVAVGTAFAATLGAAPVAFSAENPFALKSLDKGYMVASNHDAKAKGMKEGKCGEGKCGMSMADSNKDGKVSKEEHNAMFEKMDTNKDGFVDKDEMAKMMGSMKGMDGSMKGMEGKCGAMKK